MAWEKESSTESGGNQDTPKTSTGFKEKYENMGVKIGNVRKKVASVLKVENEHVRVFLAELIGTFVFIAFSLGSVAQFVFAGTTNISFISLSFGFGLGLTFGIVIAGKVSGFNTIILNKTSDDNILIKNLENFISN